MPEAPSPSTKPTHLATAFLPPSSSPVTKTHTAISHARDLPLPTAILHPPSFPSGKPNSIPPSSFTLANPKPTPETLSVPFSDEPPPDRPPVASPPSTPASPCQPISIFHGHRLQPVPISSVSIVDCSWSFHGLMPTSSPPIATSRGPSSSNRPFRSGRPPPASVSTTCQPPCSPPMPDKPESDMCWPFFCAVLPSQVRSPWHRAVRAVPAPCHLHGQSSAPTTARPLPPDLLPPRSLHACFHVVPQSQISRAGLLHPLCRAICCAV